jgi:protein gp37
MEREWARSLRDECEELGVSFFMKQMTGKKPIPPDLLVRQFPKSPAKKLAA